MAARNPVARGTEAELLAAARIIELGGVVLFPMGHAQAYDMVADFSGRLSRVQVRRAWHHSGRDRWDVGVKTITTIWKDGKRGQLKQPLGIPGYDVLAVMAGVSWYLVPAHELAGRSALSFHPAGCRERLNRGKARAFDEVQYLEAWSILQGGQ